VALCPPQIPHGRAWDWTEPRESDNWFLSQRTATLLSIYQSPPPPPRHHNHRHVTIMELGYFLIRSFIKHPEVSVMVTYVSFCLLVCSFLLPSATCYEAFCLHVVSKLPIQFPIYQYTRVYFPEDRSLHQHLCEIFKSPIRFNTSIPFLLRPVEVDVFSIRTLLTKYCTSLGCDTYTVSLWLRLCLRSRISRLTGGPPRGRNKDFYYKWQYVLWVKEWGYFVWMNVWALNPEKLGRIGWRPLRPGA
jgi:hypothetical protein